MSELSGNSPRAACEILNVAYEDLLALSAGIESDRDSLKSYIESMRRLSPGLAQQAGGWVGLIRENMLQHGVAMALRAEGAFTAGNLMMFELLRRSAEAAGLPMPDADFRPDSLVDDEIHNERPEWLLEISFRGEKLFRDHKSLFDAALLMFARSNGNRDPERIREMLFAAPDPTDWYSFDLVHYLNGAAESVLPLERSAQIAALER